MSYQHLSNMDRLLICYLIKQGLSISAIGRQIGRSKSTISRELKRNRCSQGYIPLIANQQAVHRRSASRNNMRYQAGDFLLVVHLLELRWSPEQIHGYLKRKGFRTPSHETIYRYIWRDKASGGLLWKHLRQSSKKRRKRYAAYDSRGRLAQKRSINERPSDIETRLTHGHWEIDTVHGRGSNACILTLVERKTGYLEIGKLKNKSTAELNRRLLKIIRKAPELYQSITADNGTEFHQYQQVEKRIKHLKFYFAKPYHSWERGSNENTNGLIRQYLPKGKSMHELTQRECDKIADAINMRPRKRHDYKAPIEVLEL